MSRIQPAKRRNTPSRPDAPAEELTLNRIRRGETARVKALKSAGSMRRRLLDIGLVEGTRVECVQRSPAGDPVAYLIRGAVIALREEDSSRVLVEYC
ncbi:MAG TPA: ferrous iron transport protein A [Firmicutes bacterium]|nr:ferrous iron transport protein A [Bacillota bacterium]